MLGSLNEKEGLRFVCRQGESALAAIESCLDNGLGVCFVLDDDRRLLDRVEMEDLRWALREGGLGELARRPSSNDRQLSWMVHHPWRGRGLRPGVVCRAPFPRRSPQAAPQETARCEHSR